MATEDAVLEASRLDFGGSPAVILENFGPHTLVEVQNQFKWFSEQWSTDNHVELILNFNKSRLC